MGRSKNIPPPESTEGGFVKPPDESKGGSGETEVDAAVSDINGGFVTKESEDSKN